MDFPALPPLHALLLERALTVSVAESCTGGLLGAALTALPGSSNTFTGGIIAYANAVKLQQLGVLPATLEAHGAVSGQVAAEMAAGVRRRLGSDLALAVTGIAGPGGGSPEKPVGLVWIGLVSADTTLTRPFHFPGDRQAIRTAAVNAALTLLWHHLSPNPPTENDDAHS
jgi:nicotinamide-nucleotide amidase